MRLLGFMDWIYEPNGSKWKPVKCPICGKKIYLHKNSKKTVIHCNSCKSDFPRPKDGAKIIARL